jgi:hypothetical protein
VRGGYGRPTQDEGFLVVRYLYEQRPDGRYVPSVSLQLPGKAEAIIITDPEGRTYRDLNRALEMDFWLLTRWRTKHAPKLQVVVTP